MQGKIIKGIAGFYYVHVVEFGVYECKAKGVFRKEKIKPLVGDNVEIEVLDESEKKGNIVKILPRQNEYVRQWQTSIRHWWFLQSQNRIRILIYWTDFWS